jgi:CelD/BcsL family acetyltransferase involved in cellulose biosynthesis
MKVVCTNPQFDPLWRKLVERHKSDVFQSPEWIQVLAETYDFELCACVLLDDTREPYAGLPFSRVADIKGQRLVTLPFSDYCDPLVSDEAHWRCLTESLVGEGHPFTIRCLHNNLPLADDRFLLVNKAKWHGLDLRPDLETLWLGLDDSARRAIKKAERTGVMVRCAEHKEELRAFFELHLSIRKYKYRLLAQPYLFFENIWHHFIEKRQGALMLALYQGEIIGGVMFLEWQDKLYYKFNASHPDYTTLRPNDLITWEGIKYGKAKGYTRLDFGLSDWDQEGLVRYKRKFATEEKTISFLRHTTNAPYDQVVGPAPNLLPQLTTLFTDKAVPDGITEKAGEILYRFFT